MQEDILKWSENQILESLKNKTMNANDTIIKIHQVKLPLFHYALFKDYTLLFKKLATINNLKREDSLLRSGFEFAMLLGRPQYINYILDNFEIKNFSFFPYWCIKINNLNLLKKYADKFDLEKKYHDKTLLEHLCLNKNKNTDFSEMYQFLLNKNVGFSIRKNGDSFLQFLLQLDFELSHFSNIVHFSPEQLIYKNKKGNNCLHEYIISISLKEMTISDLNKLVITTILNKIPELIVDKNNEGKTIIDLFATQSKRGYAPEVQKFLKEKEKMIKEKVQLENLLFNEIELIPKTKKMKL